MRPRLSSRSWSNSAHCALEFAQFRCRAPPWRVSDNPAALCSIGRNVKHLIERSDEEHVFRLHKDRVYYLRCENSSPRLVRAQRDSRLELTLRARVARPPTSASTCSSRPTTRQPRSLWQLALALASSRRPKSSSFT
jgi:hypothetical protein